MAEKRTEAAAVPAQKPGMDSSLPEQEQPRAQEPAAASESPAAPESAGERAGARTGTAAEGGQAGGRGKADSTASGGGAALSDRDSEGLYNAARRASSDAATSSQTGAPDAKQSSDTGRKSAATAAKPAAPDAAKPAVYRPPVEHRPSGSAGTLVFVVDDVGNSLSQLAPFLRLPFPITFAVMPGLANSAEAARRIRAAGKELILHQPMQPVGSQNPGPGAIFLSMSPEDAAATLERNLDSLPGAVGFNNHEGSAVTQNEPIMEALLAVAKRRGIYYLDSRTIAGTATHEAAAGVGVRYWERDVFLDNSPDKDSIVEYIDVGKKKAQKGGSAVMIGHVWSANLASTLMELYPQLVEAGFSLSTISEMILEESHADPRN